jgi:hypothetical protein
MLGVLGDSSRCRGRFRRPCMAKDDSLTGQVSIRTRSGRFDARWRCARSVFRAVAVVVSVVLVVSVVAVVRGCSVGLARGWSLRLQSRL